jgi:hypothetical protein
MYSGSILSKSRPEHRLSSLSSIVVLYPNVRPVLELRYGRFLPNLLPFIILLVYSFQQYSGSGLTQILSGELSMTLRVMK